MKPLGRLKGQTGLRSDTGVIIVAAGTGSRFGGRRPKQFIRLGGKSLVQRSVEFFAGLRGIQRIVLVVPSQYIPPVERLFQGKRFPNLVIVSGGRKRQDSVWNGIRGFDAEPNVVLVHDAARPFLSKRLVGDLIGEAKKHSAAVPGLPLNDTIKKEGKKGFLTETIDRSQLRAVQTPQCFDFGLLVRAHRRARRQGVLATDDAALVELLGIPIRIVQGDQRNIKITTRSDLELARILLRNVE